MRAVATTAAVLGLSVVVLTQGGGWRAKPDLIARLAMRPGINYDEARVPAYTLPDLLRSGPRAIKTPAQWAARRQEILELFRDTVYGRSPGRPEHLAFNVIEENPRAMDGTATLRRVAIVSLQGGRTHQFDLTLFLPNRPGPAPVFLLINNRPASNTDPTRREKSGFWPAEHMIARGYGIAAIQYGQLAPDDKDTFRNGVIGLFDGGATGKPPYQPVVEVPRRTETGEAPAAPGARRENIGNIRPTSNAERRDASPVECSGTSTAGCYTWAALAAWGWGASRALDYLVREARVDASRVALVGHSRGGKAALWAGAEDARFAMVVSNESGEGGAALSRRAYGETIERITTAFPHWFTATYQTFNGREAALPIDQHMLLASIAPRALYVASADEDLWADPRGEFLSLAASSPAFGLFGDAPIAPDAMPPLDTPLVVGRRGYHVRTGDHNLTPYDWDRFADFADRVWRK